MSGHTKGPWLIDEVEADLVEIRSGSQTGRVEIASVQLGYYAPIGDEQRANARLIAAAPEMLGALKGVIEYDDETHFLAARRRLAILAAIAKAEGRS